MCGIRPQIQQDGWVPAALPIFSAGWATPLAGVAAAARGRTFVSVVLVPGCKSLTLVLHKHNPTADDNLIIR